MQIFNLHPAPAHKLTFITLLILLPLGSAVGAGQRTFKTYFDALPRFWDEVYAQGGETLYCGKAFGPKRGKGINIEHVFPMGWVTQHLGCGKRKQCRKRSGRFNQIEADMHNLYPARSNVNKARGAMAYGKVDRSDYHFDKCEIKIDKRQRRVTPRPASRGNIARAMFYMHSTYGLTLYPRQGKLLLKWHRNDPPDSDERRRNNAIHNIQGERNPYIDQPERAANLSFHK